MSTTPSLEQQLIAALRDGQTAEAHRIGAMLYERGFEPAAIEAALSAYPELEAQLADLLRQVVPRSRRAAKRRAIRNAEQRDWGDWQEGKRK